MTPELDPQLRQATEELRSTEVDLPERDEFRFVLPKSREAEVLTLLRSMFEPRIFSDKGVVRTIYFNNPEHEVPWGHSLKAREYYGGRGFSEGYRLDFQEEYYLELKSSTDETGLGKRKQRFRMSLRDAGQILNENSGIPGLTSPLRPFLADEYQRTHFVPKSGAPLTRITSDSSVSYFLIDKDGTMRSLGDEGTIRIEVKVGKMPFAPEVAAFLEELEHLGARRTISKKNTACWLEGIYRKRGRGVAKLTKEITDSEIESKLVVLDNEPFFFFNKLVKTLRAGLNGFIISPSFPHILESGSFNSYYQTEGDKETEGIKFLTRPDVAKAVFKSQTELVNDIYGLGCILKRRELKGSYFPLDEGSISEILERESGQEGQAFMFVGELERLRKAFWIDNQETGRAYHVSIDRCRTDARVFYELEIEYTGTIGGKAEGGAENAIIADIAGITRAILDRFPTSVRPEPLTKVDWLRGQAKTS